MRTQFPRILMFVLFAISVGCSQENGNTGDDDNDSDTGDSSATRGSDTATSTDPDSGQTTVQVGAWRFQLDAEAVPSTDSVSVTVIDEAELNNRGIPGRSFLVDPVEIGFDGLAHTRLAEDAIISIAVDPSLLQEDPELIYVAYWTGNEWTYYLPDAVDTEAGAIRFHIDHFSLLGPTRLTKDEFYDKNARALAVNKWQQTATREEMTNVLGSSFDDALYQLGVRSAEARRQMIQHMLSTDGVYDAFLTMTTGTNEQFNQKMNELLGTALVQAFQSNPTVFKANDGSSTLPVDYVTTGVNLVGTAATMFGKIDGGDYQGALQALADGINNAVPAAKIATAISDYVRVQIGNGIEFWHRREIEEAYQAYKYGADGEYGYDLDAGNFTQLTLQMKGIYQKIIRDAVAAYAAATGQTADEIYANSEVYAMVVKQAEEKLKKQFDDRLKADAIIEPEQAAMKSMIVAFDNQGLLDLTLYTEYTRGNEDVETRLARLLAIRGEIGGLIGTEALEAMTPERLARLIDMFIYAKLNGTMSDFINHLISEGLIKIDRYQGKDASWVQLKVELVDYSDDIDAKNLNYAGTYQYTQTTSETTVTSSWTYVGATDTYPDPDMINGETYTSQTVFSTLPARVNSGETFPVTITASVLAINLSYFDGSASGRVDVTSVTAAGVSLGSTKCYDENGNNFFEAYANNPGKPESVSGTVTVIPGTGVELGEMRIVEMTGGGAFQGRIQVYYVWQVMDVQ